MRIVEHHGTTFWLCDGAQRILCVEAGNLTGGA